MSKQNQPSIVSPAQAGVQGQVIERLPWVPAFAGMTTQLRPAAA